MKIIFSLTLLLSFVINGLSQKGEKLPRYFDNPIVADSSSTMIIPTRYNEDLSSGSKIAFWRDYYANIIFYDFKADTHKKLFEKDTYIKGFSYVENKYRSYYNPCNVIPDNISSKWVFYLVKAVDHNGSGRIDSNDPFILYASDKKGNQLKAITPIDESALEIEIHDRLGFALIKMQRDMDKDKDFEASDKDYYYIRLDLNTLELGNKVELSN